MFNINTALILSGIGVLSISIDTGFYYPVAASDLSIVADGSNDSVVKIFLEKC